MKDFDKQRDKYIAQQRLLLGFINSISKKDYEYLRGSQSNASCRRLLKEKMQKLLNNNNRIG